MILVALGYDYSGKSMFVFTIWKIGNYEVYTGISKIRNSLRTYNHHLPVRFIDI
jgi:hypothetical protein